MAEDIVRSNADLAEVTHFADETFLGRGGWITVLVDDRREQDSFVRPK